MTIESPDPQTDDERELTLEEQVTAHFESGDPVPDEEPPAVEEGSEEAVDHIEADDDASTTNTANTATTDADPYSFGGRTYTREDVEGVVAWVSSLTPEQMVAIERALNPEPVAEQPPATPPPAPITEDEEIIDGRLAQYVDERFSQVSDQLDAISRAAEQQQALEAQRQEQILAEALTEARQGTKEKFGLSDEDMAALEEATTRSNYVGYLAQQRGLANPRAVFEEAMETVFYATPEFRERVTQDQVNKAIADAANLQSKKSKAGSLAGRGGAAPKPSSDGGPKTPQQHMSAIVDLLKKDMIDA